MAELCVWVSSIQFRIFYHLFYSLVSTVCGCVIDIDGLELNVERRYVCSVKPDDVFPYFIDFTQLVAFG